MKEKLDIILVEDDFSDCKEMTAAIDDNSNDFNLVSITNNAAVAVNFIKNNQPDVLILDLELSLGQGSGFDVLKGIKDEFLNYPPYIVITTNNISNITHAVARENGGDYIFVKSQTGYSASQVINFLKTAKTAILNRRKTVFADPNIMSNSNKKQHLYANINNYLLKVGISPKLSGYDYLKDAIYYIATDQTRYFIKEIAIKHNKTHANIERSMQNAINSAWSKESIEDLLMNYKAKISSEKGVPTINEFVYYYANLLKIESKLFE